jgi:hypothetical protein
MRIDTARFVSRTRSRGRIVGGLAALGLALTLAAPAAAAPSATATLAPIGTGAYLLTVTNTGSEPITKFIGSAGEEPIPSNFAPSSCGYSRAPFNAAITCTIAIAPGASGQMCYTGKAMVEVVPGQSLFLNGGTGFATITAAPAVASCPVAGFNAGSGNTGNAGGAAKCVVPNLKGKTLASAEQAITKAHCAVGKVKKAKSNHVKKGRVVSQGAGAGKSLPTGTKVSLVVSKGK